MKIPQYENQVGPGRVQAAQGQLHGPNPAAFGGQLAQAGENMGRSLLHAAGAANQIADTLQRQHNIQQAENQRALERQEQRERNLRKTSAILNWRRENDELLNGKMNEDGSRVEGGLLTTEYGAAAGITKTYDEQARGIMKKYLDTAPTEEEREEWALAFQQDFQNNFDTVAQHQYKQQRAQGNLMTKAYLSQQEGLAGAVRTPEQMRANLDNSYKEYNDNAKANAVPAEKQKLARYGIAGKNVKASVDGAIIDGNLPAARSVLESAKNDLLPDDYNQLNFAIKKAEEVEKRNAEQAAKKGRVTDDALYEQAIALFEGNPERLQQEITKARNFPYAFQQELAQNGIDASAKDIANWAKWAQEMLDNPQGQPGQQKIQNFQRWQEKYAGYNIDEKKLKVGNKDLRNPGDLIGAIQSTRTAIEQGQFTKEDAKKAQEKLSILRQTLGKLAPTPQMVGEDTVGGKVLSDIHILVDGDNIKRQRPTPTDGMLLPYTTTLHKYDYYDVGGLLQPEEKGLLIEETYGLLQTANINLETKDPAAKEQAQQVAKQVIHRYLQNKFVPDYDDVMQFMQGDNLIKSYAVKPNPRLGDKLVANYDNYRLEEANGVRKLVRRDANGRILHEQLY